MEASSGTGSVAVSVEVIKKATEIQERQVLKVLEGLDQQSQQLAAHKIGLGTQLNVSA